MPRDPNMRTGRITAAEIIARNGKCNDRWSADGGEYSVEDAYEQRGPISIRDVLNSRVLSNILGRQENAAIDVLDASEIIFVVLDPDIVGEKVFRLMLADLAETNLEDFESSKFNNPSPRIMVDAIRSFAFGTTTVEDLITKTNEAYEGENSRADVYFYGKLAVEPPGSKVLRDLQGLVFVKMKEKTLEQLQAIIDRMKEYDAGTADLTAVSA